MRVVFYVRDREKRISDWQAVIGARRRVPGASMGYGDGVPHDLVQYVIEAATGYEHGFWGLVAQGATFKSTGRRRTRPGRAIIAAHRAELAGAERLAGLHVAQWKAGIESPVGAALDAAAEQWRSLGDGEMLVFTWPSPHGAIERLDRTAAQRAR